MAKIKSVAVLVVGAGPCGLGTAHRLTELNQHDYLVVEAADTVGGLATSYQDAMGFTWDVGGHVVHSHYPYFDQVFHQALQNQTYTHQRESWVWLLNRFIPYPFQNNLRYLPKKVLWDCVQGLLSIATKRSRHSKPTSFQAWIIQNFGEGIAKHFLFPYNQKVWCHPLNQMNASWVGDRVATIDLQRVLENILTEKDDVAWGPNHVFHFPKKGGTGALWHAIAKQLPAHLFKFRTKLVKIDATQHLAYLDSGDVIRYQHLVSTIPLHHLTSLTRFPDRQPSALSPRKITQICQASAVRVIGIGLEGKPAANLTTKCWMYYPESLYPFFRVTIFSNYSPANVPGSKRYWSIMCEVAEKSQNTDSEYKKYTKYTSEKALIAAVLKGLKAAQLMTDQDNVVSTWTHTAPLGYPIPTKSRDTYLEPALRELEQWQIYSRGRFGAWKYEVSNMDHTFMQGVEVADRIVTSDPAAEITLWQPNKVNHR
jgi:protoporphyrinogen oxidase